MLERSVENIAVNPAQQKKVRNQSIEWTRLLAAIVVIFGHCGFSGILGDLATCLAGFAVAFFFVVSGYFSYQAKVDTIKKRTLGALKLNIMATMLYVIWGSFQVKYIDGLGRMSWLMDKIALRRLIRWVVISKNPFSIHLWYLAAILVCYFIMYIYVRWQKGEKQNYFALYIIGVCLYANHIALGSMATAASIDITTDLYRNALFYGLPMFALGIFIREYQERIIETYRLSKEKLVAIIFAGVALGVLQLRGTGMVEMTLGVLFGVIALMLLLTSAPQIFPSNSLLSRVTSKLGELSLIMYIVHPVWKDICYLCNEKYASVLGNVRTEYLTPIWIILLSVFTGIVWIFLKTTVNKMLFKRK